MAENYKPKKIVGVYDFNCDAMKCPNCRRVMEHESRRVSEHRFRCQNEACRLFGVGYNVVKTLVTMEREKKGANL
jgi:hypothetical protein